MLVSPGLRLAYQSLSRGLAMTGSFFQNNNGILESLVSYVSNALDLDTTTEQYLVDTYCGSGLFAIALASRFTKVSGVEISVDSVKYAKHNAELNGVENCDFIAGNAEAIFDVCIYFSSLTEAESRCRKSNTRLSKRLS